MDQTFLSSSPEETFSIGARLGQKLKGGEVILFSGGLGAGKTLFTKGLMEALRFDPDEVTSPSFALVNLYKAKLDVYHIDLWRIAEQGDPSFAVGLDEILEKEDSVVVVEWGERLEGFDFGRPVTKVSILETEETGRSIRIETANQYDRAGVN